MAEIPENTVCAQATRLEDQSLVGGENSVIPGRLLGSINAPTHAHRHSFLPFAKTEFALFLCIAEPVTGTSNTLSRDQPFNSGEDIGVEDCPTSRSRQHAYETSPQTQRAVDSIVQIMLEEDFAKACHSGKSRSWYPQGGRAGELWVAETATSVDVLPYHAPNCRQAEDILFRDDTVNRLIELSRKTWPMVSQVSSPEQYGIPRGESVSRGLSVSNQVGARGDLGVIKSQFWVPDDYVRESREAVEKLMDLLWLSENWDWYVVAI